MDSGVVTYLWLYGVLHYTDSEIQITAPEREDDNVRSVALQCVT
jgi:hypothetical protein